MALVDSTSFDLDYENRVIPYDSRRILDKYDLDFLRAATIGHYSLQSLESRKGVLATLRAIVPPDFVTRLWAVEFETYS